MRTKALKLIMESKQGWLLATPVHQKYYNTYRVFDSNPQKFQWDIIIVNTW